MSPISNYYNIQKRLRRASTLLFNLILLATESTFSYRINHRKEASRSLSCLKISPGQHVTRQGEVQKSTAFLFPPNNLVCFHSFSLKDTSSQLAALSIIYFGCLLENKWSCSCRWVCQTYVYFPVSGPLLFWLKPDPLKWIPGHQKNELKEEKNCRKGGKNCRNFSRSNIFLYSSLKSYVTK